ALFNRLAESRQAIVDEIAGVTLNRRDGIVPWLGREVSLLDPGGHIIGREEGFEDQIRSQVQIANEEATALIFVVDTMDGLTDFDKEVAAIIRKSKKPVLIAANKVDTHDKAAYSADFYQLGLGEVFAISAVNGSGTGDLLDRLIEVLPPE